MQVGSLGQEDPLEEGTATHSSVLAWRISWTEGPGGLQCIGYGCSESVHTHIHVSLLPQTSLPPRLGGILSDLLRKRSTGPMVL